MASATSSEAKVAPGLPATYRAVQIVAPGELKVPLSLSFDDHVPQPFVCSIMCSTLSHICHMMFAWLCCTI
jgi:hypothetical protein